MFQKIKQILSEGKTFRLVFVGDSLTSTEWVHPNWREIVEYVLKQEMSDEFDDWKVASWQIRTINCGFDGSSTRDIRSKLEADIMIYKPSMVLMMIGGNDKYFLPREESKDNFSFLISHFKSQNIPLVLTTDPALFNAEHDARDADLREIVRSHAQAVDVFVDLHKISQSFPLQKFFTFFEDGEIDFLHPNMLGNAYIARVFLKEVFDISFDPEKYLEELLKGEKYPRY